MKFSSLPLMTLAALCAVALCPAVTFAAKPRALEERGIIKSVDADTHTLVVADAKDKAEHKFQWNELSKFTTHGKPATAAAIKAGEQVRLTYKKGADTPTIERMNIVPAKTGKTSVDKS